MKRKPDLDIIIRYLNYWDPAGECEDLIASGAVPDPYDRYALRIHEELERGCASDELLRLLEKIQTQEMALTFQREKAEIVAKGLVACFKDYNARFY